MQQRLAPVELQVDLPGGGPTPHITKHARVEPQGGLVLALEAQALLVAISHAAVLIRGCGAAGDVLLSNTTKQKI